jgi:DNA-binding MarR family transcriptional regulator
MGEFEYMSVRKDEKIKDARNEIFNMRLSRLIVFNDVLSRFLLLRVKEYHSWIKVNALLFLISREDDLTPSSLAKLMLRSNNSITDLLNDLERHKLIRRIHSKKDQRVITIKITSKGIKFAMDRLGRLTKVEEELKTYLDENELSTLVSLVRKLRRKIIESITGLKSTVRL